MCVICVWCVWWVLSVCVMCVVLVNNWRPVRQCSKIQPIPMILSKCILCLFIDHYEVYSTDSELLLSMITISCGVCPMILCCTIRCALFVTSILKHILLVPTKHTHTQQKHIMNGISIASVITLRKEKKEKKKEKKKRKSLYCFSQISWLY